LIDKEVMLTVAGIAEEAEDELDDGKEEGDDDEDNARSAVSEGLCVRHDDLPRESRTKVFWKKHKR
jgi:hypothetical protein